MLIVQLHTEPGQLTKKLHVVVYPFPWQSVVEITTTVTDRHDELDEVVCDLLSSLTNCSLGNGLISEVG